MGVVSDAWGLETNTLPCSTARRRSGGVVIHPQQTVDLFEWLRTLVSSMMPMQILNDKDASVRLAESTRFELLVGLVVEK